MPPPPLPAANSTNGNGPFPAGSRSPIGAYTPSSSSTYISCTGNGESFTASVTTMCSGSAAPMTRSPARISRMLDHDARIAQVLIAIDQVDLTHRDQPAAAVLNEAMAAPAGQ